jgi:hypothetical protein
MIRYQARLVKVKNVSADVSERQALSNLIRCSRSRDPIMKIHLWRELQLPGPQLEFSGERLGGHNGTRPILISVFASQSLGQPVPSHGPIIRRFWAAAAEIGPRLLAATRHTPSKMALTAV